MRTLASLKARPVSTQANTPFDLCQWHSLGNPMLENDAVDSLPMQPNAIDDNFDFNEIWTNPKVAWLPAHPRNGHRPQGI